MILALQNFFIGESISHNGTSHAFAPFGFSGVSSSRNGDNSSAELVFANTEIARGYADESMKGDWVAEVDVCIVDLAGKTVVSRLFNYAGITTAAAWDQSKLTMELSSVLDAVGNEVPGLVLTQKIVGSIPASSTIQLL